MQLNNMAAQRGFLAPQIARILRTNCTLNVLIAGGGSGHSEPYWDRAGEDSVNLFLVDPLLGSLQAGNVIGYALSDNDATCNLHMCQTPAASSLRPLSQAAVKDATFYNQGMLSELMKTVKVVSVQTTTVDGLQAKNVLPPLDIIKLNIEGSELDALRGAQNALRRCLGVQVEVSFKPAWEGAPYFSDIDSFLREQGFEFHQFLIPIHHGKLNKYMKIQQDQSMKLYPYPSNQMFQQHALYLRPDSYVCEGGNMSCSLDAAVKFIFVCEIYGLLEKAFYLAECLEQFISPDTKYAYCQQLQECADEYMKKYGGQHEGAIVVGQQEGALLSMLKAIHRKLPGVAIRSRLIRAYREGWK
jgi:FkbM family methyltransferase